MVRSGVLIPDGTTEVEIHEYIIDLIIVELWDPPDPPESPGSDPEAGIIIEYVRDVIEMKVNSL